MVYWTPMLLWNLANYVYMWNSLRFLWLTCIRASAAFSFSSSQQHWQHRLQTAEELCMKKKKKHLVKFCTPVILVITWDKRGKRGFFFLFIAFCTWYTANYKNALHLGAGYLQSTRWKWAVVQKINCGVTSAKVFKRDRKKEKVAIICRYLQTGKMVLVQNKENKFPLCFITPTCLDSPWHRPLDFWKSKPVISLAITLLLKS